VRAPTFRSAPRTALKAEDGWTRTARAFVRHRTAFLAGFVLGAIVLLALGAPLIAPYPPDYIDLAARARPPGPDHLLGTDRLGRDIASRLLYGARVSLFVAGTAILLATVLGTVVGLVAGYLGGWVDVVLSRTVDALLSMPTFFILVAVQSLLPPSVWNVVGIIGLTVWLGLARIVRGQVLSLREREFILAARAVGVPTGRIILRHLLPNVAGPVIVFATLGVADAILIEAALSFLGLGVPPFEASWGNMLTDGQVAALSGAWWIPLFPGLVILITALAVNLVGDGLQQAVLR
jgi:peptide/nickel transport system permease protein